VWQAQLRCACTGSVTETLYNELRRQCCAARLACGSAQCVSIKCGQWWYHVCLLGLHYVGPCVVACVCSCVRVCVHATCVCLCVCVCENALGGCLAPFLLVSSLPAPVQCCAALCTCVVLCCAQEGMCQRTGLACVSCCAMPCVSALPGRASHAFCTVSCLCAQDVPDDCTVGFRVEFVWKPTSFDRMHAALKQLDQDRTSISGFLYHTLLGGCGPLSLM